MKPLSVAPLAPAAAVPASPANSPAPCAAARSSTLSPIATPPRGAPPAAGVNTPSGRFWIGKSAWPLAEATQLLSCGAWVASSSLRLRSEELGFVIDVLTYGCSGWPAHSHNFDAVDQAPAARS